MAANRYAPHLYVIPEDDANRQIAVGFEKDYRIRPRSIQIVSPAGGWKKALEKLSDDYYRILEANQNSRVLVIIDCDCDTERISRALDEVPEHLRDRVFIVGTKSEPELLRKTFNTSLEKIGQAIADECFDEEVKLWSHEQLIHNSSEVKRLKRDLFSIVFDI